MVWGWEWLEDLAQDVRYGLRTLRKSERISTMTKGVVDEPSGEGCYRTTGLIVVPFGR
jgi:hypothetical protein